MCRRWARLGTQTWIDRLILTRLKAMLLSWLLLPSKDPQHVSSVNSMPGLRITIADVHLVLSGCQQQCWELVTQMLPDLILLVILWGSRIPVLQVREKKKKKSSEHWVTLQVNDWAGLWNQSLSFKSSYSVVFNYLMFIRNWVASTASRVATMHNSQDMALPLLSEWITALERRRARWRVGPGCLGEGKGCPWQTSHQER